MFAGLRIEALPQSTLQDKYVYTLFKAENQEIQFPLLCTKLSKDKVFFFQRLLVPGRFIGQPCLACTIGATDLSAKHAKIVEWSGAIYRPYVPIRQDFCADLSANCNKGLKTKLYWAHRRPSYIGHISSFKSYVILDISSVKC